MKNIYFVWGLIVVLLLSAVTFMGYNIINSKNGYKVLEKNIKDEVESYLGEHLNEYPEDGSKKIKVSYIMDKGYDINLNVNEDVCDGYVVVKKENVGYSFKSYIKCHDYTTKGYKNKKYID